MSVDANDKKLDGLLHRDDVPTELRTQHVQDLFKLSTGKRFGKMNGQSEGVQVPDFEPTIGISESVGLTRSGSLKDQRIRFKVVGYRCREFALPLKLVVLIKITLRCLQQKHLLGLYPRR